MGWIVCAMGAGQRARLKVDEEALKLIAALLDRQTDWNTGRVGPRPWNGESVTAAALLARYLLGQGESHAAAIEQHRDLLLANLPAMEGGRIPDLAYVFYGTFALHQEKAKSQEIWNEALRAALLGAQAQSGEALGSWDAAGPVGSPCGSRSGSTALAVLSLRASSGECPVLRAR